MLYWLFYEKLFRHFTPFRVFQYVTFRTAFAALTALFLCLALGPWLIAKLREFQIGQYIREDGPKVAHEEGRHAHHGRHSDHHLDRDSHAAVGESGEPVRVDRDVQPGELRADRLLGRLRQGPAQTKSGPDGEAEIRAANPGRADGGLHAADAARAESVFHQHERAVFQIVQAGSADRFAAAQLVHLSAGVRVFFRLHDAGDCGVVGCGESHRRPGRTGDRADDDRGGRHDGADLCDRPRARSRNIWIWRGCRARPS